MTAGGPLLGYDAAVPSLGMVDLGLQILKVLAVIGGATVGGLGSGWLLRFGAKVLVHRPVPPLLARLVQLLGAVLLGWAVWLWVYGLGGSGWGMGGGIGGLGSGVQPGTNAQKAASSGSQPEARVEITPDKPTATTPESGVGSAILRVEMLGGARVREQRFYRLEGETEARTFTQLRQAIAERRQQKPQSVMKSIDIVIYENSVSKDHPAVKDLEKWARENDLTPMLSFPQRELP